MASFHTESESADVINANYYQKALVCLFKFPIPKPYSKKLPSSITVPYDMYTRSLTSSLGTDPKAMELINALNEKRAAMLISLYSSDSNDEMLLHINNYIPILYHFIYAIEFNSTILKYDRPLQFEWRGYFSTTYNDILTSSNPTFELIMVLHTKAILLNSMAKSLLDISPLTFLSESGKYLLEASSILSYISTNITTGKWKNIAVTTNTKVIPPELSDKVCNSLSLYLKGGAQALSCAKAICIGPSSTLVRARLCVGVVNSLTTCISEMNLHICTIPETQYLTHVHVSKQLFTALAYQFCAHTLVDKTEVGNAIACCIAVKDKLSEQNKSITQPWLVKSGLLSSKLLPLYKGLPYVINYILNQVNELQAIADRENRFVYFQQTPDLQHTQELLPPEASVMKPPVYVEPEHSPEEVRLIYNPKSFTNVFSDMMSNVSNLMGQLSVSPSVSEKIVVPGDEQHPTAVLDTTTTITTPQADEQSVSSTATATAPPVENPSSVK